MGTLTTVLAPRRIHQERFRSSATPTLVVAEFEAKVCGLDTLQPHFSAAVSAHGSFIAAKLLNDFTTFGHDPSRGCDELAKLYRGAL